MLQKLDVCVRRMKLDPYFLSYTHTKSRCIKALCVGLQTSQYRHRQGFSEQDPLAQEVIPRGDEWNYMKLRSFCTAKGTIARTGKQSSSTTHWAGD